MLKNLNHKISILIKKYEYKQFQQVIDESIVIHKKNDNEFLWNLTGLSFQNLFKIKKSIDCFENALKIRPGYDKAAFNMALVKRAKGFSDASVAYIDQALLYNPTYRQALYKRGEWAAEEGNYARAVSDWQKLLELVGDDERLRVKIDSLREVVP